MNWIVTIVIGGIVGWVASKLMKTDAQMGLLANIVVGIVGASVGFWLAGMLGLLAAGPIAAWIVAIAGAMVLIFLLKAIGIFK
ncbi:MAG: GlsB/YeaQ/YmgE family stress response membrane protein [Candidatus Palauibacterales bacterium]|nr:GlsB/YeaQ/YmgE family stress response membrane protein [Candidatus Palauibacterales bacterium]